jgi:hypothetical protein
LPSVFCRVLDKEVFAKCRTRQSPVLGNDHVYREQDSRHRKTLGKDTFVECSTLGERQLSAKSRQPLSKADGRYLCREPSSGTRQTRSTLGRASFAECPRWTLGKVYFYFFYFANQTFCGMFLHYVDLHVPFWDNYKSVFYNY